MTPVEMAIAVRLGAASGELVFHVVAGTKRAHNLLAHLRRLRLVPHGEGRVERGGPAGWMVVVPGDEPAGSFRPTQVPLAHRIREAVKDWLGRSADPWTDAAERKREGRTGYHRKRPGE